jgi:hypothetical protein
LLSGNIFVVINHNKSSGGWEIIWQEKKTKEKKNRASRKKN